MEHPEAKGDIYNYTGRVSSPAYVRNVVLAAGSLTLGVPVEGLQTGAQAEMVHQLAPPTDTATKLADVIAQAPDAKALGVGLAAVACVSIVCAARNMRNTVLQDIGAGGLGIPRESLVEPWERRAMRRADAIGIGIIGAFAGYKLGTNINIMEDMAISTGMILSGVSYYTMLKKRLTDPLTVPPLLTRLRSIGRRSAR